jgi:hypothetical protein
MSTQKFISDRKRGHLGQTYIAEKLRAQGYTVAVVKDGHFEDYDLVAYKPGIRFTGEVKTDYRTAETGNLCLELQALRHSKASLLFYVIVDQGKVKEALFCPLQDALRLAESYPVKGTYGERGEVSSLVPLQYFISNININRL